MQHKYPSILHPKNLNSTIFSKLGEIEESSSLWPNNSKKVLIRNFSGPSYNVSESANSYLRGVFDGWRAPKVHPTDKRSVNFTIPPRKNFSRSKLNEDFDALPSTYFPEFGVSTFTNSEKDSETADRITLSNWMQSCAGAKRQMVESLKKNV